MAKLLALVALCAVFLAVASPVEATVDGLELGRKWVPGGLATGLGHTYPWSSWGSWGNAKADAKEGDDKWGHGWGLNWGHSWDRAAPVVVTAPSKPAEKPVVTAPVVPVVPTATAPEKPVVTAPAPSAPTAEACTTVAAAATATDSLSTLVKALKSTGLASVLDDPTLVATIFAPTNDAFAALLKALDIKNADDIFGEDNKATLTDILKYHVIAGVAATSDQLTNGQVLPTLLPGQSIKVDLSTPGAVKLVPNLGTAPVATVAKADIKACKAVVHVVDQVLLPASAITPAAPVVPTSAAASSSAVASAPAAAP